MRLAKLPTAVATALVAGVLALAAGAARASDLTGAESCRVCHAEAYRIWSQSPHARAVDALQGEQRKNQLCLYCHSRDEARAGAVQVASVSCETCHGGGRFYQPVVVMRDKELSHLFGLTDLSGANAAATCLSCHGGEGPSVTPFDLKEALSRIDHWSAARAARKPGHALRSPHRQQPSAQLTAWLVAPAAKGARTP